MRKLYQLYQQQTIAIQVILLLGVVVQIITSITAVGFFHPDQHYQIIEFSSYQLNLPNATNHIWELKAHIRSTLQVYIFTCFTVSCNFLGITDAFTQTTILRVITGIVLWFLFNTIALVAAKKIDAASRIWLFLIINFSWYFPYCRSLFNSEMISSLVFFGTLFWYSTLENSKKMGQYMAVGILLAMAFYLRFQFAFGIVGFGFFILLKKRYTQILPLIIGFFIGVFFNTFLDFLFYKQWVCSPYLYFKVNITEGKAAEFGQESFTYYIYVLLATVTILPISIFIFWHWIKQVLVNFKNVYLLATLFFIIGHMCVGHKEERFMFPVIQIMPIIVAGSLFSLLKLYNNYQIKTLQYGFKFLVWLSLCLNVLMLVLFMIIPYAQTLHFASKLNKNYKQQQVLCLQRTPLETESLAPYTFYAKQDNKVMYTKILTNDSLIIKYKTAPYLATTFNQAKNNFKQIDSLGYKPVAYSNELIWKLNSFLQSKSANTINDIWVLYQLK